MSDNPQGDGWWQASDGKWYPPEAAPSWPPTPTTPAASASPSTPVAPSGFGEPVMSGPSSPAGGAAPVDAKGFLKSLYDFQFDYFVTPRVLRFLYALFVILLSIGAIFTILGLLASGESGAIFAALIIVPIGYLVYVILTRIWFEVIAALFRIADDLRAIRRQKGI